VVSVGSYLGKDFLVLMDRRMDRHYSWPRIEEIPT
jgi:hypothetical protein